MRRVGERYIPDHRRCMICYVYARNGVIKHTRTCASYVPPTASATSVRVFDILRK